MVETAFRVRDLLVQRGWIPGRGRSTSLHIISTLLENWSAHLQRDQSTQYTVGCLVPSTMTSWAGDYFAATNVSWQHRLAVLKPDQRVLSRSQDGRPDPGLTAFAIHVVEPVPDGCLRPVNFIRAHKH